MVPQHPSKLQPPRVGEIVEEYGFDYDGNDWAKESEVIAISEDQISLKPLRTRRRFGVTEEKGHIETADRRTIETLSIPKDVRWRKHYKDHLAIKVASNVGGSLGSWNKAVETNMEDIVFPNPP